MPVSGTSEAIPTTLSTVNRSIFFAHAVPIQSSPSGTINNFQVRMATSPAPPTLQRATSPTPAAGSPTDRAPGGHDRLQLTMTHRQTARSPIGWAAPRGFGFLQVVPWLGGRYSPRSGARIALEQPGGGSMRGIANIIFGVIMVIGGLSGKLVLIGTGSGTALAVVGGILIAFGVYRLAASSAEDVREPDPSESQGSAGEGGISGGEGGSGIELGAEVGNRGASQIGRSRRAGSPRRRFWRSSRRSFDTPRAPTARPKRRSPGTDWVENRSCHSRWRRGVGGVGALEQGDPLVDVAGGGAPS